LEEAALALILDRCLAAVQEGSTPQAAADRYPAVKSEILPLLQIAHMLSHGTGLAPEELPLSLRRLKMRLLESPA